MPLPECIPMDTEIENLTPLDAMMVALWLVDHDMPVPVDVIAKAHSGGFYFAH